MKDGDYEDNHRMNEREHTDDTEENIDIGHTIIVTTTLCK